MTSIFDLKTNIDELSSANEGTSRLQYDQHAPTRDVTDTNFPNGAIHIRWQTSGTRWWIPSRSYLRIRSKLTKAGGAQLDISDNIAPNMGLCGNLFQSMEFRINDKTVSRVSDFVPQVDALETRLTKSRSYLNGAGKVMNWWEDDFKVRANEVSSDGLFLDAQTPIADTVTSRVALGYDALGANNNAYEIKAGEIAITRGTSANDLPVGVWNVGDYFRVDGGANDDEEFKVLEVTLDGVAATTLRVQGVSTLKAASVGDFEKVVKNGNTGSPSRRVKEFENIWSPPLSIFKVGHALPSGKYELIMNPQTSSEYQKRAIESIGANKTGADFKFEIIDMYFYTATVEGPRADDVTYLLDLEQTRCQTDKVDNTHFVQKNFDVSPSTYALTVAYQDVRAGNDTRSSSSKFKSFDAGSVSLSEELKIDRFFLNYAGQNLPAPDANPSFVSGTDYTTQRYAETQIYSGAMFDTGGAQSIEEFQNMGQYFYFSIPRDGTDRSTRVNVHQSFDGADVVNMRVLLFDHSKQVARIRVQNGRVVDVQVEDA